jgi:hypothetical protein
VSTPSWDIKYLEDVERRLKALEARAAELEKALKPVPEEGPTKKR